jgi:hypothetical protein
LCFRFEAIIKSRTPSFKQLQIYEEARRRLESSTEEWNNVNTQVAEFYSEKVIDITNSIQVETAHKAINHYHHAEEFEKCYQMLLHILGAKENLSNLRCSDNLWKHDSMIIEICKKLTGENKLRRYC